MDLEKVKLAYSQGKKVQSLDCYGRWEDFIPQNQLDKPNWEYSDKWRVKPEDDKSEELKALLNKVMKYEDILQTALWIDSKGKEEIIQELIDLDITQEQIEGEGVENLEEFIQCIKNNLTL